MKIFMKPETVVQHQLEAYNARDLQRFIAVYSDQIKVFRPPALEPAITGRSAFAEYYATQRFNRPNLRAEVLKRIVLGNKVIDHERIFGVREQPIELVMVYQVAGGLIQTVWLFSAE